MSVVNIHTVLAKRPLGMAFDIDGTISPYVHAPQRAQLYPGVARLLEQAREHAQIAILTSRAVDNAAAMVNIDHLTYIGTYGLEWCDGLPTSHPVRIMPQALPYIEPGRQLLDLAEQQLDRMPGITIERKRIGGTIHYRLSPDPERARQTILSVLEKPVRLANMRLQVRELLVEVNAPFATDKGDALRRFVKHFALQGIIFAGDDNPDIGAFIEVSRLRCEGIAGFSVVVQHAHSSPILLEHADIMVQEVPEMATFLAEMVQMLVRAGQ